MACGNELPTDEQGREDFEAFYTQYYADSLFQLQRTEFPLLGQDPTGEQERFYWDIDNWQHLKPIEVDDSSVELLPIIDMDTWMRERILIHKSFYIEKQFTLINNKWYLTSYSGITPIN